MKRIVELLYLILDQLKTSSEMAGKRTETIDMVEGKNQVTFNAPYAVAGSFSVFVQAWDDQGRPVSVRVPYNEITVNGFNAYSPVAGKLTYNTTINV